MIPDMNTHGRSLVAIVIFLVLGISGCSNVIVNVDLRDCPNPVLCSPIMRIGDTAPPENELVPFDQFTAKVKTDFFVSHSQSQRVEGNYVVTTSRTDTFQGRCDDIAREITKATASRSDLVVVVEEIKSVCFQHNSIIGFVFDWISVKGKTVHPDSFKRQGN